MDSEKTTRRFDKLAANEGIKIDRYLTPDKSRISELQEYFLFADLPRKPAAILEIGSGRGNYSIPLLQLGHKITCIDISSVSLDILKTTAQMLGLDRNLEEIYHGDFFGFEAGEKKYDLIIGADFLHHISGGFDAIDNLFYKISTLLKHPGKIIFKEPNPLFPWRFYFLLTPTMSWKEESGIKYVTKKNLKFLSLKYGFKKISHQNINLLPIIGRSSLLLKLNNIINHSHLIKVVSCSYFFSAEY